MDFYRIECFLTAAEMGSMSKAAEKMCMTQPAMSFQIRELEKELQVTLFERDHIGIRLTESGKITQAGLSHIMESYRRLLNKIPKNSYDKMHLTVGYHGFINWAGLHSFIAVFSKRHPEIEVSIMEQQCKELADYLELGNLDVAILIDQELKNRQGLSSMSLFHEKTCFAVPNTHPLANRKKITIEDLKDETILMNNHNSTCMNELVDNLIRSGIPSDKFRFEEQPGVCLAMAVAGQGLVSLPKSFQQNNLPLSYVDYDSSVCSISHSLAWNSSTQNPAVKLFCEEVSLVSWPFETG
ncbi:hypothetical protein BXO88_09995 [Oribacterium sp. C9]|uniref:LysR family transcriptional regulator n=1 Tax=Oribacterium sp. C9 TaxID=1943579 RepID=UPI00098FAA4B|nr:LysR family transcriptional regulator [Oribacterium sp. C9]OON85948.1 hypothetical protein BXO88_09995 [Oribacterium sp. C9]